MSESNGNGVKAFDVAEVERQSVIERPDVPSARAPVPSYDPGNIFFLISQAANTITAFGKSPKIRDAQLRQFWLEEPIFASALGIISARNAGFSWKISGPPRTANKVQEMFDSANLGEGWHDLIIKTSIDLYTQDNGAFWEIVRINNDDPNSPVIGVNHIDAQRCTHTGAPLAPVIYLDRKGRPHLLRRHQVITFAEMPVPIEGMYGMQYCVLSRILRGVQVQSNIDTYNWEKTSGRHTQAIHLVKGITTQQLNDAIAEAKGIADAAGYTRYAKPIVTGTLDPKADVGHDTIDLVSMPEAFKADEQFKQYMNLISMGFSSDYQEFAPLPGGGLGTGNQSEILHLKNRGKGPGLFMKLISHAINFRILPTNVQFYFDEQDVEADKLKAEVEAIRAQTRATRIQSTELPPEIARQIANDEGDLADDYLELIGEMDLTDDAHISDDQHGNEPRQRITRRAINVSRPDADRDAAKNPNPTASRPVQPQRNPRQ